MYYHIPLRCLVWTGPLPSPGTQVRWDIAVEKLRVLEAHEVKDLFKVNVVKIVEGQGDHPLRRSAEERIKACTGEALVLKCCHMECDADAEWEIISGPTVDDYTHACTKHVGDLLCDAPQHTVHPIKEAA